MRQVIDAETFLHGLDFPESLTERAALLTFDDGCRSIARSRFRCYARSKDGFPRRRVPPASRARRAGASSLYLSQGVHPNPRCGFPTPFRRIDMTGWPRARLARHGEGWRSRDGPLR
jgi:hypothetical protein